VSKTRRAEWRPLIEEYLRQSASLRGIVQLLDARHDPTDDDRLMLDLLADIGVPAIVAVTKTDKLAALRVPERLHALAVELELDEHQVIPFSAVTGAGRDELAEAVVGLLEQPSWRSA
jgi:GTP-binding protein